MAGRGVGGWVGGEWGRWVGGEWGRWVGGRGVGWVGGDWGGWEGSGVGGGGGWEAGGRLYLPIGLFKAAMSPRSANHRPRQDWRALRDLSPTQ